jgi:hypothetical protein
LPGLPRKLTTPGSAAILLVAAFVATYAADAGHGFIKDDFRWIRETRIEAAADASRLLMRSDGFYRPLVSLTFSINSAMVGINPRGYGATNFVLVAADAVLVFVLATRLGLPVAAALLAAGVWAFNFHGINMSILWISGRTASMLTLGALAAAIAFVADRKWLAACGCFAALLSKEEAVLLPVVLAAWAAYDARGSWRERALATARRTWPCWMAVGAYVVLRLQTNAFWPASAPTYYRFTLSPVLLLENILQYADRAITASAAIALVLFAASRWRARWDATEQRVAIFGMIWLVGLFGITVFVPVRSSLYAVLPSAGAALVAGAVAAAAARVEPSRVRFAFTALAVLPLLLMPVYWSRNERWVRLADVSSTVLAQAAEARANNPNQPIVLLDSPGERFNLDAAFGALWPDAAALCLPPGAPIEIGSAPRSGSLALRLENGRLIPEN